MTHRAALLLLAGLAAAPPPVAARPQDPVPPEESVEPAESRDRGREGGARRAEVAGERRERLEERGLRLIELRLVEALIEHRPWLAIERGDPDRVKGLGGFEGAELAGWSSALASARDRLSQVAAASLSPARQRELSWLNGWLHAESLLVSAFPVQRRDPGYFVEGALRSLEALVDPDRPRLYTRMDLAWRMVDELPTVLEVARLGCAQPVRSWGELALETCADLRALLEERLPEQARDVAWSDDERAAFEGSRAAALTALGAFETWLQAALPDARPEPGLPSATWLAIVRSLTGLELDPEPLALELLAEIGQLQARLAGRHAPPLVEADAIGPQLVRRQVEAAEQTYRERMAGAELGAPPGYELVVEARRTLGLPRATSQLRRAGAERWKLLIELPGDRWPGDARVQRAGLLAPETLPVLALRHGAAGEARLAWTCAGSTTLTRAWISNRLLVEGFGQYAVRWADSLGWHASGAPGLQDALLRARLLDAARLEMTLGHFALGIEDDQVERAFAQHTGLAPELARRELLETSRDPLRGLSWLVARELAGQEERLAAQSSREDAVRAVLRAVVDEPCARIADLFAPGGG